MLWPSTLVSHFPALFVLGEQVSLSVAVGSPHPYLERLLLHTALSKPGKGRGRFRRGVALSGPCRAHLFASLLCAVPTQVVFKKIVSRG